MTDATRALDDIEEEIIFKCIDGIMMNHYLKLNGTDLTKINADDFKSLGKSFKMLQMPKSKCEFCINKTKKGDLNNWHYMNTMDPPPYSEQARAYTRKQFATVLLSMSELEPSLNDILKIYVRCAQIEKSGKGKVLDYKAEMNKAQTAVMPHVKSLDDYYKRCKP